MAGATKGESKREEAAKRLCDRRIGDAEKSEVEDAVKELWGHRRSKIQLRGYVIVAQETQRSLRMNT